ncbi:MAG: glycosyltransferase family 2 protein, partial [Lactococcus lactis]|nr:glycosyltransferase family 2 protein [Lactococcus lactis]
MSNLKKVNSLIRSNKKIEAMNLLKSLIISNPRFKDYYISYLILFKTVPKHIEEIAHGHLVSSDLNEFLDLQLKLNKLISKKWNDVKFTFCISVKNRSCVTVSWDGVTKNKTFVTSYKNNPMSFQLELLKNFIKSIVDSKIKGVFLEIIVVDFNSDDHPPEDWMHEIVGVTKEIEAKVIKSDEPFSRGRGLNIAAENATGDIIFFTDADMIVSREFLIQSLEYAYDKQKPFFPICYSYYTPYSKEGWVRDEGWGNLVIPKHISEEISWWEKRSWGSEDNHMKDQLGNSFARAQAAGLYHQWHPEEDFKTKYYASEKNKFEVVLAVTTYNRLDYLEAFIKTWLATRNPYYKWHLIINDDGSTDGTIEYLKNMDVSDTELHIIYNIRKGVHEGTNAILDRVNKIKPDYIFKCDDDVIFVKKGWDNAYIDGMNEFGFLCNYQTKWRDAKVKNTTDKCISYSSAYYSQGAFLAFSMDVVNKVGWFDTKVFGFKGYGHIDFAVRACRAGFNDINTLYDIKNSSSFITLQFDDYRPALDNERMVNEFKVDLSEDSKENFKNFILNNRS